MCGVALAHNELITGSYDGEIIVWNTSSETVSRKMTQRCQHMNDLVRNLMNILFLKICVYILVYDLISVLVNFNSVFYKNIILVLTYLLSSIYL